MKVRNPEGLSVLDRPLKATTMFAKRAVSRKLRSNFHNARIRERERESVSGAGERSWLEWVTLDPILQTTSLSSIYADHLLINSRPVNNGSRRVGLSSKEWTVTERMAFRRGTPPSRFYREISEKSPSYGCSCATKNANRETAPLLPRFVSTRILLRYSFLLPLPLPFLFLLSNAANFIRRLNKYLEL